MDADAPRLPPCPFCGHEHGETTLKCPDTDMVMPLEGRLLGNKFRLSRELGKGGMATVWLAMNTLVDRPVAIKLIRPEVIREPDLVARFRSEAKAAGRIGHPNVCDILDFGTSPVGPYIVMEYLHGRNLGQLIAREGKLTVTRALTIVRSALSGLHAAHERGVIHRDLKPENIFLHHPSSGPAVVKLMDFGVAKFTDGTAEIETGKGALLGTPEYMAPEQFQGAELVEPRTDVWAIGAILYRALTGDHAFRGPTVAATLFRTTQERQRPMREIEPSIPERLEKIVDRCLEKKVADRYPTVAALDQELRSVLEELEVPDVAPSLGITQDDSDRISPILIGPPSLSEVVDAIAAESIASSKESLESSTQPPRVPTMPIRDSAPTLDRNTGEKLKELRAAADVDLNLPGSGAELPAFLDDSPAAPAQDEEIEEIEEIEELDVVDEVPDPEEADAVPDPIEDATTGIADLDSAPETDPVEDADAAETKSKAASPPPVSPWPVALVAVMLILIGLGAWQLMSRNGDSSSGPTTALAEQVAPAANQAMVARAEDPPSQAQVPPTDPVPVDTAIEPPIAAVDEAGEESGSSGGPLVDDPPPADDEVIEILEDETDPSVLEDGGPLDAEVLAEDVEPQDTDGETEPSGEDEAAASGDDKKSKRRRRRKKKKRPAADEPIPSPPAGVTRTSNYITPLRQGPRTDQSGARRYCRSLAKKKYLGVSNWRLAHPGAAKAFSKVHQMKRGRYWTSARYKGRAKVVEVPTANTATLKVSRKFWPLCIAKWD